MDGSILVPSYHQQAEILQDGHSNIRAVLTPAVAPVMAAPCTLWTDVL